VVLGWFWLELLGCFNVALVGTLWWFWLEFLGCFKVALGGLNGGSGGALGCFKVALGAFYGSSGWLFWGGFKAVLGAL
jgi:hypothetical protein